MAQKPTTTKNLDSDVAKELEEALDFDLTSGDGDLDIAASMEDLEAQISQAADELARESGQDKGGASQAPSQRRNASRRRTAQPELPAAASAQTDAAAARQRMAPGRPPTPPPLQPAGLSPANDDRQKDFRAFRQALNRRASNGIYWVVLLLSLAWVSGGAALGHVLFGADIWKIRTVEALLGKAVSDRCSPSRSSCRSSCSGASPS